MCSNKETLTQLVAELVMSGWSRKDIAGLLYGDTSRAAQRRVAALISKAKKNGLIPAPEEGNGERPVSLSDWRPEAYPRAPFEIAGSSGPRSMGFLNAVERKRLNVSDLVNELGGVTGLKEYPTLYAIAQDTCAYLVSKYPGVNDTVALGCVMIGFLSAGPQALLSVADVLIERIKTLLNSNGG